MSRWQRAGLAAVLTVAACVGLTAWFAFRASFFRKQELAHESWIVASQISDRVRGALEQNLVALRQMVSFYENSREVDDAEFRSFAADTYRLTPLCLRIGAVGPSFRLERIYPNEPNAALVGFDLQAHAHGYETLTRARDTKQAVISRPLTLLDGQEGFIVAVPVFYGDRFGGAVVGVFRTSDFFAALMVPEVSQRHEASVLDSGARLFSTATVSSSESARSDHDWVRASFSLGGGEWEVRVRPKPKVVSGGLRAGGAAIWTLGGLLAIVLGFVACAATLRASAIAEDVRTQRRALDTTRERLDEARRQLLHADKLTALGEIVAGVAHEVNNPLSSVLGYLELLLARDLAPDVRRRLEVVHSEAERVKRIVRNLLAFARKEPPERRYLGLNGLIEKSLELRAYHLRAGRIRVEKDLEPDLPMTMLDFQQIQQVLLNLLNNAEQALAESGHGGTIRLSTRRAGDRIEARIADDGPGIAPEVRHRIFEPFFTTKPQGKGTGLGLPLCYGIVREHGGEIRVESSPGGGATFVVSLPIVQEAETADGAGRRAPEHGPSGLRILLVDDEPVLQDVLVDLLTARGHRVDTASDVPEALRKIGAGGHDLIISDMKMPRGSGRDIYRAVIDQRPELIGRLIFMTGDGSSTDTAQFLRESGGEVVLKPFPVEELERAIARSVER